MPGLPGRGSGPASPDRLDYPALVLHESALEHNLRAMADYCHRTRVLHAPHAKTTLAPEIVRRQLAHGAWAMTAATPAQVRGLARLGAPRILLANVLVDAAAIDWVATEFLDERRAQFWCYVDSVAGVRRLDGLVSAHGHRRSLDVLLEVGYTGGRTGVRDLRAAVEVAHAVAGSASLRLAGVAGYEGLIDADADADADAVPAGVVQFLASIHGTVTRLAELDLLSARPLVSAGGSAYFDLVIDALGPDAFAFEVRTVLRAGCYAAHDHGRYARTSPPDGRAAHTGTPRFRPALELLASVWSCPEPGLAIVGFGRRDAPTDAGLPRILGRYEAGELVPLADASVETINDQHAFVRLPPDHSLHPGDVLSLGISHPCGAFDRWPTIPLLSDDGRITGLVHTDL